MSKLLSWVLGLIMAISFVPSSAPHNSSNINDGAQAIVDRIEENYAVVEFSKGDLIKMQDILLEDINEDVSEGARIPVISVEGKFYEDMICTDFQGNEDIYYQFRSDDDALWWLLTASEIGHIPNLDDKYTLFYMDNGTTEKFSVCGCLPEWDCECYLYDDIFFHIEKRS